ncbi:MAG: Stp1/IreP family PP2C-type Ser/Thr phosphatase [Clostridia bacterium]|nr:Stp1/IreP family PP2C-type Ser/Thr phosphatase [Clostridia bacterium]
MIIHSKIDKGIVRNSNQDAFIAGQLAENITFAIVCDGMGGANAGNIASEIAVKTVSEYLYNSFRDNMTLNDFERTLKNAISSANLLIFNRAVKDEALKGMGTTIVAAIVKDNDAIIAHVGDSRIYLLNDEIKQLTKDHSIVQTLIENGEISPDDAKHHPRKNVITRALGVEAEVVADFDELTLNTNDTLLLCTDGLTNYVPEANIYEIFKQNDLALVSETLVAKANENGGGDNITVVTLTAE